MGLIGSGAGDELPGALLIDEKLDRYVDPGYAEKGPGENPVGFLSHDYRGNGKQFSCVAVNMLVEL